MTEPSTGPREDPYARAEYRRVIAWGPRIERERPFLLSLLERAPDRSVVDLGCGTGEHVAFFAEAGARAIGIDRSEDMISQARDHEARGKGRFVVGFIQEADRVLAGEPRFGMAISLGNTLPHVHEDEELATILRAAHALLLPGGVLAIQILNYRRIIERGLRHLPINFRPDSESENEGDAQREVVFLRLMSPVSERRILFFPTTLVLDPTSEEPVRIERSRRVELRPWTDRELGPALESAGFEVELFGDMKGGAFDPLESSDLVVVGTRKA
ncbi:MAG TPA: class I SAM-dependent methyltransferase [Planctomycetota bacterium]|nr:class I SAM-dependent methyltransferase [Planctomycetota bacterium]